MKIEIKNKYRALSGNGNAGNWEDNKSEAIAEVRRFQELGFKAELQIEYPNGHRKIQFIPKKID